MGQAKRRKQLDSTYGQFYQLASVDDLERHFLILWKGFLEQLVEKTQRRFAKKEPLNFDELRLCRKKSELSCREVKLSNITQHISSPA